MQNKKGDAPRFMPLALKPDMAEATRRWEAFWEGELLDRPLLILACGKPGYPFKSGEGYWEKNFGNVEEVVETALHNLSGIVWGAESIPAFWSSLGTDELGVFCGAKFVFGPHPGPDTVWCDHPVEDWDAWLPLKVQTQHPSYRRMQELMGAAERVLGGKALAINIDSHANLDLLVSLRGSGRLCMDLYDRPEVIDRAVRNASEIFGEVWRTFAKIGKMDEHGYIHGCYSPTPCYELASDFSALMGPEMFKRWVAPALEYEAGVVGRASYHWDGPDAIKHADMLLAIDRIKVFAYVPSPGRRHVDHVDLYKKVQAAGKCVMVGGSFDEAKAMHRELDPAKTGYSIGVANEKEMDEVVAWFRKNT